MPTQEIESFDIEENLPMFEELEKQLYDLPEIELSSEDIPLEDVEEPVDVMRGFKDFVYPNKEEIKNIMLDKLGNSGYGFSYGQRLFNYTKVIKNWFNSNSK